MSQKTTCYIYLVCINQILPHGVVSGRHVEFSKLSVAAGIIGLK
jgi:hypothetical protein